MQVESPRRERDQIAAAVARTEVLPHPEVRLILKLPTVWSARFGLSARYSRPARLPLGKSHRQTSSALRRATVLMARKSICCLGEGVCRREGELVFFNIAKFCEPRREALVAGLFFVTVQSDGVIRTPAVDSTARIQLGFQIRTILCFSSYSRRSSSKASAGSAPPPA